MKKLIGIFIFLLMILSFNIVSAELYDNKLVQGEYSTYNFDGIEYDVSVKDVAEGSCLINVNGILKWIDINDTETVHSLDINVLDVFLDHSATSDNDACRIIVTKSNESYVMPPIAPPTCKETDDGKDFYNKGVTKGRNIYSNDIVEWNDFCNIHGTVLIEYYCDDGFVESDDEICENGCSDGACNPEKKCAKEGQYTSGSVSPEYAYGCCDGLEAFNPNLNMIGGGALCYDSDKGKPICQAIGTRSEGWYYSETGELIAYDSCGNIVQSCSDSDGGKNFYEKGRLYGDLTPGLNDLREDICVGDHVRELFCNSDSLGEPYLYECPNGCNDGACVRDDDGDSKYLVQGERSYFTFDDKVIIMKVIDIVEEPKTCILEVNNEMYNISEGQRFNVLGINIMVNDVIAIHSATSDRDACEIIFDYHEDDDSDDNEIDLKNFPELFVEDDKLNAILVVGEDSPSTDTIAAVDIAVGIMEYIYDKNREQVDSIQIGSAIFDSQVSDPLNQNMIVVGNPCNNKISSLLMGNPDSCNEGLNPGEGLIKLFNYNGKVQLLVSGYSDDDVRKAARVLSEYKEHDLFGTEVIVSGSLYRPNIEIPTGLIKIDENISYMFGNISRTPSCNDNIKNLNEEGVDCGGFCKPCEDIKVPTCTDGILNDGETGVDCGGPCKSCEITTCNGCLKGDKCLPFGTRLIEDNSPNYCDISGVLNKQNINDVQCQNNYECVSNQCSDGVCTSLSGEIRETKNLILKLLELIMKYFPDME
ncbi:hypothetical protein ACFL1H_01960 [Nanoarchaeota archaeon]